MRAPILLLLAGLLTADDVVFVGSTKVLPDVPWWATRAIRKSRRTSRSRRLVSRPRRNPFVDPKGYRQFLDRTESEFRRKLESEKLGGGQRGSIR